MSTFLHFLIQNTLAGSAFLLLILLFRRFTGNLSKLYVRLLWLLALPVLLLPQPDSCTADTSLPADGPGYACGGGFQGI